VTDTPAPGLEPEPERGDVDVDDLSGGDTVADDATLLDDDVAFEEDDGADYDGPAPTAAAVLHHIVRSIVDDAGAVQVDGIEGRSRVKLEVRVGDGDLGRVIGRRGRTAQSIRTVVRAAATRDGVEVDVDFAD
jgi:predicted RNA-binding protein YlqC (UPF0109 family)